MQKAGNGKGTVAGLLHPTPHRGTSRATSPGKRYGPVNISESRYWPRCTYLRETTTGCDDDSPPSTAIAWPFT